MNKSILKLADLLPDNVTEETMNKILGVIQEAITGEVTDKMKVLEAKAGAFIRKNIDNLKAQAQEELNEENEIYQDAMQFRKLKGFMGVDKVEVKAPEQVKESKDLQAENDLLVEHLQTLADENVKLKRIAKAYKKKALVAESTLNESVQEVQDLKGVVSKPFKSSEKALVLSEGTKGELNIASPSGNAWLSEEVLALMPRN